MTIEERRESRRKRILENSKIRLKKITSINSSQNILNEQPEFIKDKSGNKYLFSCLCLIIIFM